VGVWVRHPATAAASAQSWPRAGPLSLLSFPKLSEALWERGGCRNFVSKGAWQGDCGCSYGRRFGFRAPRETEFRLQAGFPKRFANFGNQRAGELPRGLRQRRAQGRLAPRSGQRTVQRQHRVPRYGRRGAHRQLPRPEVWPMRGALIVPRPAACAMRGASWALRPAGWAMRGASSAPRRAVLAVQGALSIPRSAVCAVRGALCVPRPAAWAVRGAASTPQRAGWIRHGA
jgi:hypothetical protein